MFCLPLSVVLAVAVLAFGASICATPPSVIAAPIEKRMSLKAILIPGIQIAVAISAAPSTA
ncbi:Uncharacterised protein [Shigella sonnei]|nr:Uncharacterised protein [Shigella sonnei]CSZ47041.1 Uncharacterised protein [Shigella sonnei]